MKNELSVPHNELAPTAVRIFRIDAQAQKKRDKNFIVTGGKITLKTIAWQFVTLLGVTFRALPLKSGDLAKRAST